MEWAKKMLNYGFPLMWSGLAIWVFTSSDRFFLLHYKEVSSVSYYAVGSSLAQSVQIINMAVQMSFCCPVLFPFPQGGGCR